MQSIRKEHLSNLSEEAYVFRWLVRKYVVTKLQENRLSVPTSLLADDGPQTPLQGHDRTWHDNLSEAFIHVVDQFVADNSTELQSVTDTLPTTVFSIEDCVMEVIRNVLVYGDVTWGRMVAVAAFVGRVALRCVRNEVVEVVAPLIDHSALLAEQKLSYYIRENGSWPGFAAAFENINKKKKHGWIYNVITSFIRQYI
jgi:hypothetical protein